jgi:hypothetical protein
MFFSCGDGGETTMAYMVLEFELTFAERLGLVIPNIAFYLPSFTFFHGIFFPQPLSFSIKFVPHV